MRRNVMVCLGLLVSWAAPALGITEFQSFTLKKAKYKAPSAVPAPDAAAEDLFKTKFIAKGELVLGTGSDGVAPAVEAVRITVGEFTQTLPAGSMTVTPRGVAKFKSKQLGSLKLVLIKPTSTGFKWVVKGNRLLLPAPAALTLQIGDDAGRIDLATGAAQPLQAVVRGTMVSGDPPNGLDGVVITIPCPSGMCMTVTGDGGQFEVSASLGVQNLLQDGRTISGGSYPRITQSVVVAPGINDVGVFALPELDLSNGAPVSAGVQAATTVVSSNPLSTGGSAAMTIAPGSTVTFPGGASGDTVAISEVPLSLIPMEFGSFVASPVVVTTQPGGTTISPPADVTFPNPYPGMSDGEQLMIYGYNNAVGDWETIAVGTVQNGGTEIFAPSAIGEFAWYFPACTPTVTTVVGLATVNGSPAPGIQVLIQGRTVTTFAPPQDLDGDAQPDNFVAADLAAGCPGVPFTISAYFRATDLGPIHTNNLTLAVPAVAGGTTHLGTVALPILAACGNGTRELGEQCDGSDAAACLGHCAADCTCFQQCGNGVLEVNEQCDGAADAACPGQCDASCICPASCGNGAVDPGEACDGADDAACPSLCDAACACPEPVECQLAPGSRFEIKAVPFPNPINMNISGTLDIACASFDPLTGPHACACGPLNIAPSNLPAIGFLCIEPLLGCPAGEITCSGGDPRDLNVSADHNIGGCTGNADCAAQCAALCGGAQRVVQSGCQGFCSQTGTSCTTDAQCLMFNEGLCTGPDPVMVPNICQCQCLDAAAGGASPAGTLQCRLGMRALFETAAPCDGVDPLFRIGEVCMPVGSAGVSGQISDANNLPGTVVGPESFSGASLSCLALEAGTTSALALRGTAGFFDTAIGDVLFSLRADCQ